MFRLFFPLLYVSGFVLLGASYWGYRLVKTETSDHDRIQNALASELAEHVANELPLPDHACAISIARIAGDENDVLNGMLRDWIHRHGHRVPDTTLAEWIEPYFVADRFVQTSVEADCMAQEESTAYVLFGEVQRLRTTPESERLDARLRLYDSNKHKVIDDTVYSVPRSSSQSDTTSNGRDEVTTSQHNTIIAVAWLFAIAALPIAASRPIGHVLRKRSNHCNAVMLIIYLLVAAVSARVFWASQVNGPVAWLLLLAGLFCTTTYFAGICRRLENHCC